VDRPRRICVSWRPTCYAEAMFSNGYDLAYGPSNPHKLEHPERYWSDPTAQDAVRELTNDAYAKVFEEAFNYTYQRADR
jgi:hypothetical protein